MFVPSYTDKSISKAPSKPAVQSTHPNHFIINTVLKQQDYPVTSADKIYSCLEYQPA